MDGVESAVKLPQVKGREIKSSTLSDFVFIKEYFMATVDVMAALIKRLEATLARQVKAVEETRAQLDAAKRASGSVK